MNNRDKIVEKDPPFRTFGKKIEHPISFGTVNTLSGGSSTYRGEWGDGIVAYTKDNKPIWIPKMVALRLTQSTIEAILRYWDVDWHPRYARKNVQDMAENMNLKVSIPYREACPFCGFVADDEGELLSHLDVEHDLRHPEIKDAKLSVIRQIVEGSGYGAPDKKKGELVDMVASIHNVIGVRSARAFSVRPREEEESEHQGPI